MTAAIDPRPDVPAARFRTTLTRQRRIETSMGLLRAGMAHRRRAVWTLAAATEPRGQAGGVQH